MASIIEILKKENPNHFMYLDAGDQFQGAFESSKDISSGEIIADYFNHMKLDSSAVGNH
jgi:2',3'-cyclic-nucleotide 2'-phosphodiesterase (5'-nucleotidase family)